MKYPLLQSPSNISAARNVLPASGWSIADIFGREFSHSDLRQLADLGSGDASFTWEREIMGFNYFETLLNFRLDHYHKYGFGVHGLWLNGVLIGQCGLQVFDDKLDRVECAVFLGKAYTRKGLGWELLRYLIQQSKSCGMTEIYGVARPDNPGAVALMHKLKAVALENVYHFKHEATVFRIDLNNFIE